MESLLEEDAGDMEGPESEQDGRCLQSLYVWVREPHLHEKILMFEYRTNSHLSSRPPPPPTDC